MLIRKLGSWTMLALILAAVITMKLLIQMLWAESGSSSTGKIATWNAINEEDLGAIWIVEDGELSRKKPEDVISLYQTELTLDDHSNELVNLIRKHHLLPPSKLNYNILARSETSMGQAQLMQQLFENKRGGFFIECGAYDGEGRSNTLTLERDYGWEGLLVEADPTSIGTLQSKNRHSWLMPNCLATDKSPMTVSFRAWGSQGKIVSSGEEEDEDNSNDDDKGKNKVVHEVMCMPLFAVLRALNVTKVDYFSLDVEGNELDILKTIPWDEVEITALSVEFIHIGEAATTGSKSELESFMLDKGYTTRAMVTNKQWLANDFIFVKHGFRENILLKDIHT